MKCTDEVLFKDIEVNITDIDQALLNIDNKVRSNLFSWNGQFSPQFIEVMLNQYAEEEYRLYDPSDVKVMLQKRALIYSMPFSIFKLSKPYLFRHHERL